MIQIQMIVIMAVTVLPLRLLLVARVKTVRPKFGIISHSIMISFKIQI